MRPQVFVVCHPGAKGLQIAPDRAGSIQSPLCGFPSSASRCRSTGSTGAACVRVSTISDQSEGYQTTALRPQDRSSLIQCHCSSLGVLPLTFSSGTTTLKPG